MLTKAEALAAADRARSFPKGHALEWLVPMPSAGTPHDVHSVSHVAALLAKHHNLARTHGGPAVAVAAVRRCLSVAGLVSAIRDLFGALESQDAETSYSYFRMLQDTPALLADDLTALAATLPGCRARPTFGCRRRRLEV